jgi:hypothetical protein
MMLKALMVWRWRMAHWYARNREAAEMWVVWHMPKRLVMWAFIRVTANALNGHYSDRTPSQVSVIEALGAWPDVDAA